MFVLMCVPLTRDRSRNPLAPLRFARGLPNRSLRFWAESGAGSDPPPIVRSTAPESALMRVLICGVRGRSQPAPAARMIPAGRLRTRLRQVQAATGDGSGRRVVLDADTGIEPPLTEAAHLLVARLHGIEEPVGLRRVEGGLVRPRDAGGDHNGAPLRPERTAAGVRGRRPRPPGAPAAAREAGGSEGGYRPLASAQCSTLGRLALLPYWSCRASPPLRARRLPRVPVTSVNSLLRDSLQMNIRFGRLSREPPPPALAPGQACGPFFH